VQDYQLEKPIQRKDELRFSHFAKQTLFRSLFWVLISCTHITSQLIFLLINSNLRDIGAMPFRFLDLSRELCDGIYCRV
jgi:hypothetical protein